MTLNHSALVATSSDTSSIETSATTAAIVTNDTATPATKKVYGPITIEVARAIVGSTIEKNRAAGLGDQSVPKAAEWAYHKVLPRVADPNEFTQFRKELRELNPPAPLDAQTVSAMILKRIGKNTDRETIVRAVGSVIALIYHDKTLNDQTRRSLVNMARDSYPKITLDVVRAQFEISTDIPGTAAEALKRRTQWEPSDHASIDTFIDTAVKRDFTKSAKTETEVMYAIASAEQLLDSMRSMTQGFRARHAQPSRTNEHRNVQRAVALLPSIREPKLKPSVDFKPSLGDQIQCAAQKKEGRQKRAQASNDASRRLTPDMFAGKTKKAPQKAAEPSNTSSKNKKQREGARAA